jgi:DNA primase
VALERLACGWHEPTGAWTFPMRDDTGRVIGIRTRTPSGLKRCVPGSRTGCFYPVGGFRLCGSRLVIVEGPTDLAALLHVGFVEGIGRPSCSGGAAILLTTVRAQRPAEVVLMPDSDAPGTSGAIRLARQLLPHCPVVRVVAVPGGHKDVRDAVRAGYTGAEFEAAFAATAPMTLSVA